MEPIEHSKSSLSPKEVIQAYFSAFSQGNVDETVALLDENVIWHIDGDQKVSTVGLLQGRSQVKHWLENFPKNFEPLDFTLHEIIEHKDSVIVLGRFRHIVLATGKHIGSDMAIHFKVSHSKITYYQIFEDSALLARAFDPNDDWEQEVKINGTLYHYWDMGEGPTLIFAHGLFGNHDIFKEQVNILSKTHRCIVLDMPGHGKSGYNPDGWTLDDITRDLALMIQELSLGDVIFLGQGQGGMVGMQLAAFHPHLLSKLILIGTSARAEFQERLENWKKLQERILKGSEKEQEVAELQSHLKDKEWLLKNPAEAANERKIMLAHHQEGLALALEAAVFKRGDLRDLLEKIKTPTLVMCGEKDTVTPLDCSQEIAAMISTSSLKTLANVGHHPAIEAPQDVTNAITEFLG